MKFIMKWDKFNFEWNTEILNEEEKINIAKKVASKVKDGDVIGFGSGSTSYLAVKEIARKIERENINITAIPTSHEIKMLCASLGIKTSSIMEQKPDWSFDGTDEYNEEGWLIKGRGAAMFKEKLNIVNSEKVYILADNTKFVKNLGEKFTVPVECFPDAVNYVKQELANLGAEKLTIRCGNGKDGPVVTENNNFIIDAKFSKITKELESKIKSITGVIESGLFIGYKNVEILK